MFFIALMIETNVVFFARLSLRCLSNLLRLVARSPKPGGGRNRDEELVEQMALEPLPRHESRHKPFWSAASV